MQHALSDYFHRFCCRQKWWTGQKTQGEQGAPGAVTSSSVSEVGTAPPGAATL